jgi:hypothetical protein
MELAEIKQRLTEPTAGEVLLSDEGIEFRMIDETTLQVTYPDGDVQVWRRVSV